MINSTAFDYVNVLTKAADASYQREAILANNISNVDTPGYKRKDLNFEGVLSQELGRCKHQSLDKKIKRKIDEAIKNIELRTGKTANDADLAKELSISEDELCNWQSQLKVTNVVSLDEFDESGPEPVMDAAHNSHYAQPEEIVTQEELKTMLVKSLDNLTEKERRVIELYYYEDLTLKEISNILEVSESRVSQLHTKGLIKMRKVMGPYMNILTNA